MDPKGDSVLEGFLEEARNQEIPLPKNFENALFKEALRVQTEFSKGQTVYLPQAKWPEILRQIGRRLLPLAPGIVMASTIIGVILGYYVADSLEVVTLSALGLYPAPTSLEIYGNIEELLQLDVG